MIFFLTLIFGVNAQSNLQFSQAKLLTKVPETVPAGKVWKVTSVFGQSVACELVTAPKTPMLRCEWYGAGFM